MLYHDELHRARVADLLREAEHERLVGIARAARLAADPDRRSARGSRWAARRFAGRVAGRVAARFTHRRSAPADAGEVSTPPIVTTAGRPPVTSLTRAPDGSIPQPRQHVPTRR